MSARVLVREAIRLLQAVAFAVFVVECWHAALRVLAWAGLEGW